MNVHMNTHNLSINMVEAEEYRVEKEEDNNKMLLKTLKTYCYTTRLSSWSQKEDPHVLVHCIQLHTLSLEQKGILQSTVVDLIDSTKIITM
jgi:hypothetical protein